MPKQSEAWKDLERRHAKRMGGVRIWRQDYSEVKPDGESDYATWDCKCYESHRAVTMFKEAEKKYRGYTGLRRFHLCLKSNRKQGDYVVLNAEDFRTLCAAAGQAVGPPSGSADQGDSSNRPIGRG